MPDILGYLYLVAMPIPLKLKQALKQFHYAKQVFIAPPWAAIYVQDAQRKQSYAEAVQTYEAMVVVYQECGYQLIELPKASVANRVSFIESYLGLE